MQHLVHGLTLLALCLISPHIDARAVAPIDFDVIANPRAREPIHAPPSEGDSPPGLKPLLAPADNHQRNRPVYIDSEHYALDLVADPLSGLIKGQLDYTFRIAEAAASLSLDAAGMEILAVRDASGADLSYTYDGSLLTIFHPDLTQVGEVATIRILYETKHPQSFYLTGPDATNPERMQAAYTFTQPEGSQMWFPCIDRPGDKALFEITVEVARPYKVLSNGELIALTQHGDHARYQYRMDVPMAPYLLSLNIGAYEVLSLGEWNGVPLSLWTPPHIRSAAISETLPTAAMMASFSRFTGFTYPFKTYTQSVAQAWGTSMEHQTATTMGGWRISGDGAGASVVAHELAHQWFGDWVTCEQWSELWLNEGFATFLPALYFADQGQVNELLAYEDYWRQGYFAEARHKIRALSQPLADWEDLFDSHAYEKGALVIKLMRYRANLMPKLPGDAPAAENFSRALAAYLRAYGTETVRHADLEAALESSTRRSWQTFFDQWVRSPGHPHLSPSWAQNEGVLSFSLRQERSERADWFPFSFPLEVEILGRGGERRLMRLDVFQAKHSWQWSLPFEVAGVQVDPEWLVPAEVGPSLPASNWLHVLRHSPSVRSRVAALRAYLRSASDHASSELTEVILTDSSAFLKADALAQLTRLTENRSAVEQILAALKKLLSGSKPDERILASAVALTEAWLVENAATPPSAADEEAWRDEYLKARLTIEREASLKKLAHASLARAGEFAIARLAEARWVTRDRAALIDVLTRKPTPTSLPFIIAALDNASIHWFQRITGHLVKAGFDQSELVDPLLKQAMGKVYEEGRVAALKLLAVQASSRERICPVLATLRQGQQPTAIQKAAAQSAQDLSCLD